MGQGIETGSHVLFGHPEGRATAKFLLRLVLSGGSIGVVEDDAGQD